MRDLFSNLKFVRSISPVSEAGNTAIVGEIVNRAGFDSLVYCIQTGSLPDAACTFVTLLEDSADGVTFASVVDADLEGTEVLASFTQAKDNKQFKLGYKGVKQYSRLTITPADNGTASFVAAVAVLGNPDAAPQSTQET